jgi:hypothetical protein
MPRTMVATALKLLLASLAVGLVLSFLNITPHEVFDRTIVLARVVTDMAGDFAGWAFGYIILGAAVVIPIWLVITLFQRLRRR